MQQGRQEQSRQESNRCKVVATGAVMAISIPCLYTKQKTKKRKTFNDGLLRVAETNGHCSLYGASENLVSSKEESLDSQFLPAASAKKILQGEYTEIEFENYFVTVERILQPSSNKTDGPKAMLSFKIPRFKPPSYTAPPQKLPVDQKDTENPHDIPLGQGMIMNGDKKGSYNVAEKELDDLWAEDEVCDRQEGRISNNGDGNNSLYEDADSKSNDDLNRIQSCRKSDFDNLNVKRNTIERNYVRNDARRDDSSISQSRGSANYTECSNGCYSRDRMGENGNQYLGGRDNNYSSSSSSKIIGHNCSVYLSGDGVESGHNEDRDGIFLREREEPSLCGESSNQSVKRDSDIRGGRVSNSNSSWGDGDSEVHDPVNTTWSTGSDRELPLVPAGVTVSDNLWGDSDEIWGVPEFQDTRQPTLHQRISSPNFVPTQLVSNPPGAFLWDPAQAERESITDVVKRRDESRGDDKPVDAVINSTRKGNLNFPCHTSATKDGVDYGERGRSLDNSHHNRSADKRVRFEEEGSASVSKECSSSDYTNSSTNFSWSNINCQSSSPPLDSSLFCTLPSASPSWNGNPQCSTAVGRPTDTFFTSTDRPEGSDQDQSDNDSSPGGGSPNVNISRWGDDNVTALSSKSNSSARHDDFSLVAVEEAENTSSFWDF